MVERKVILLETNEIPYSVWERYGSSHPKSATARLLESSALYETLSEDLGYDTNQGGDTSIHDGHITPWTTWPTVHRGVTNQQHKIMDIGQDLGEIDHKFPPIWQLLAESGHSVGVFGSLHSYPMPADHDRFSFYVPDPFATSPEVHPKVAEGYQRFSLALTSRSGRNASAALEPRAALGFIASLPRLGIRPATIMSVAGQLISERMNATLVGRRRAFQSLLSFDIYIKLLESRQPDFSTFFVNHVAAAMHRFWAAAWPADYPDEQFDQEWTVAYAGEIEFSMSIVDKILDRVLKFVDEHPDYCLVTASSMSQGPTASQRIRSQVSMADESRFMASMGVNGTWRRTGAMFPNFNVFVGPQDETSFRRSLRSLVIGSERLKFREAESGFFSMDFGQCNLEPLVVEFMGNHVQPEDVGLENMAITDHSNKCADHRPVGPLMVYGSGAGDHRASQISTAAIAPAILTALGCDVPPYMTPNSALTL